MSGGGRPRVVDARVPSTSLLEEAAGVLRGGGLVAFPTETVYGLGAVALDERAVGRVFAAKGRPTHHPLIVHVLDLAAAHRVGGPWSEDALRLAAAFWPGPLTLVVGRGTGAKPVPLAVTGGHDSVAVRVPRGVVAQGLLAAVGEPLAAPSANRYQSVSPTRAADVVRSLGAAVDLVLDGGPCAEGIESTVVDVREGPPQLLRPGAVPLADLRRVVSNLVVPRGAGANVAADESLRPSPGMDRRHYAPRARLHVVATREDALALATRLAEGGPVGLVLRGRESKGPWEEHRARWLPDDPAGYGRSLFATLHDLDDAGVAAVVVEAVPEDEAWMAVADRLRRAGG